MDEVLIEMDRLILSMEQLIRQKIKFKALMTQQMLAGKIRLPGFTGAWEKKKIGDIGGFWQDYLIRNLKNNGFVLSDLKEEDLLEFAARVPQCSEQQAIAQFLADLDDEIQQIGKKLAKYQQIESGIRHNLFAD